jgi:hypothetical protein
MQIARFYLNDTETDLTPTTGGTSMPFSYVWMPPGIYTLGGQSWDCRQIGLYRFKVENEPFFRNRIVFGSGPPIDIYSSVSAVCWNHIHGAAHETTGDLSGVAHSGRYGVWRMRCGYIGNFMAWLVPQLGYQMRQISVWTLEAANGYDDGHQVVEILINGKWCMFDITDGCYWRDANGVHMSTAEFIAAIAGGSPLPTKVKLDGKQRRWDHEMIPGGTFDMGLYGDLLLGTDAQMEAWFRRIFQAWAVM